MKARNLLAVLGLLASVSAPAYAVSTDYLGANAMRADNPSCITRTSYAQFRNTCGTTQHVTLSYRAGVQAGNSTIQFSALGSASQPVCCTTVAANGVGNAVGQTANVCTSGGTEAWQTQSTGALFIPVGADITVDCTIAPNMYIAQFIQTS